ncbi:MAG: hypothetical protein Q7V01_04140 [Vicinamibacterales bacterium]|nr:hypothetical protein [Vicinamibacterales bacterium]
MHDEEPLKSSYELAMERVRREDAVSGVQQRELTAEQRAALAEARNFYEAKLAEREVLHQSTMMKATEPEALATLDQEYRRDRERLTTEMDAKLERIRRGA